MATVVSAPKDPLVGRRVGDRYELQSFIGAGSMGRVYRGRHLSLPRTVAIKVLHGSYQSDRALVARFHREAEAANRIRHPNTVEILDFGEEPDGLLYIVMEFLEGRNLHKMLDEEGLPPLERMTEWMSQL